MSTESVCRVCLSGVHLTGHSFADTQLRELHEKLTGTKLSTDNRMPKMVCSFCYSQLRRFGKFSEKAHKSENMLLNLFSSGLEKITRNSIPMSCLETTHNLSETPAQLVSMGDDYSIHGYLRPNTAQNRQVNSYTYINDNQIPLKMEKIKLETYSEESVKTENVMCNDSEVEIKVENVEETEVESSLSCDLCIKKFATIYLLRSHIISHSKEKPHACKNCNKSFSKKPTMVRHMKTCIIDHIKGEASVSDNQSFKCDDCNKRFSTKPLLKSHKVVHSGEKLFVCDGCKKSFARKQGMKQHMLTCTEVKPLAPTYPCQYCTKIFDCDIDLSDHITTHSKDKPYTCDKCNKTFTTKQNLHQHLKICFLENEMVPCSLCPETFSSRSDLCKHLNVAHSSQKPFSCDRCSAKFWYKHHLKMHFRIHTGEKPFACEVCGRTFTLRNHLKAHLGTHTGEKPHSCEVCGKAFLARFNLTEHMRSHTGERPYGCDKCGKAFGHQSTLRQHLRKVHIEAKPFACTRCSLSFALESALTGHMRVHTAERPYTCDICSKTFIEVRHLKGHMQVHSTERPHACLACGNRYKRADHLRLHISSKCKAPRAIPSLGSQF